MLDHRFSSEAFERAGFGTIRARTLARDLQETILKELDVVVRPALDVIIKKLNSMGHRLEPAEGGRIGDITFLEASQNARQRYKFLVGIDIVVSVGYPDTVDDPTLFAVDDG